MIIVNPQEQDRLEPELLVRLEDNLGLDLTTFAGEAISAFEAKRYGVQEYVDDTVIFYLFDVPAMSGLLRAVYHLEFYLSMVDFIKSRMCIVVPRDRFDEERLSQILGKLGIEEEAKSVFPNVCTMKIPLSVIKGDGLSFISQAKVMYDEILTAVA